MSLRKASGPRPQPSIAPGRKFSISTSASLASWRTMAWASGRFKSRATERLLRDCTCHQTEVPSFKSRHLRSGSPAPGVSILMTSAPKSPNVLAANGPAINCPSSSTFKPASGPWAGAVAPGLSGEGVDIFKGGFSASDAAGPGQIGLRLALGVDAPDACFACFFGRGLGFSGG